MALDRQIRGIQREEDKIKASLKEAAKKGRQLIMNDSFLNFNFPVLF